MATELQKEDTLVEGAVVFQKSLKETTGYPHNLTEKQVTRLIYFFGSRKATAKAAESSGGTQTRDFTSGEMRLFNEMIEWYGWVYRTPDERTRTYRSLITRFKQMCDFLKMHPAYVTQDIYKALTDFGYKNITKAFVMVVDKEGKVQPRMTGGANARTPVPLGKLEGMMWEFQNMTMDKIDMIVRSIEPADLKKANLGLKSKAVRDLMSTLHLVRQANKNPNQMLIGLNVNVTSPEDKLKAYSNFVIKNRDSN